MPSKRLGRGAIELVGHLVVAVAFMFAFLEDDEVFRQQRRQPAARRLGQLQEIVVVGEENRGLGKPGVIVVVIVVAVLVVVAGFVMLVVTMIVVMVVIRVVVVLVVTSEQVSARQGEAHVEGMIVQLHGKPSHAMFMAVRGVVVGVLRRQKGARKAGQDECESSTGHHWLRHECGDTL